MLTSRQAEVAKRDRLNAKGKDGGSFIPRALLITGVTKAAVDTKITLPSYITSDNFLGGFMLIKDEDFDVDTDNDGAWIINYAHIGGDDPSLEGLIYESDSNSIKIKGMKGSLNGDPFKLTVFYKG